MKKLINAVFLIIYAVVSLYLIVLTHKFLEIKELLMIISFLLLIELLFIYLLKNDILLFFSYPCILLVLICLFTINNQNSDLISFSSKIQDNEEEIVPVFTSNSNIDLLYLFSDNINIVMGVNKNTKQIVMINIPENYYVSFKNEYDIISNINKYGITSSIKSLEKLLGNRINYYIKVDFNKLGELIDKIGGIEVYSNYNFVSFGYEFKEGLNKLNGEETKIFISYNNPLMGGSRIECDNQIKVLESIITKLSKNNEFLNYLDELKKTIKTNIPSSVIMRFIKDQMLYNHSWNNVNYILDGSDEYEYTYSSKCCKLNVIKPDEMTINTAITMFEYLESDGIFN